MTTWEKLIARILDVPENMRFEELRKALEYYGYSMRSAKEGSHYTFRKDGRYPITIPKHNPIKRACVRRVKDVIESEMEQDADS